ncbi:unnamed protein product [Rhizoctonia solani]|uniref:F-box domain-containing protein n=1 Tax=Rhizoctonia solani TaxID=456999 RepID=A0A8H3E7W1_9AGAM|nr:unnamed protein product [Rhizoctonia solani]
MANLGVPVEMQSMVWRCLTNYYIILEIASFLDGNDLVQLSRTSKWLCFTIWGSPLVWKQALGKVGVNVDLSLTPFHTLYTFSILSFTTECMLCGSSTRNGILDEHEAATRLCNKCAANVLVPAPDIDQPPQFMQTLYQGGPHRYFKLILRRGVSRVRIPALMSHAKPATLYRAHPSPPNDPDYVAGNRYLQQLMNNELEGHQPRIPVHSLKIITLEHDYVALLPLSRGY